MTATAEPVEIATTDDGLLDGRVRLRQPVEGYRAGIDPVLLAAAVPAAAGETVLDVGAGAGAAALCLAARAPGVLVTMLEFDRAMAELARANAASSDAKPAVTVCAGDLLDPPDAVSSMTFDHVMTNPPYMPLARGTPASARGRGARQEGHVELAGWIRRCCALTARRGTFTIIQRADRLDEIIAALAAAGAGGIAVMPLWPRAGVAARLVLVRARPGVRGPMRLLPGLALHDATGAFTPEADAVLRRADALRF